MMTGISLSGHRGKQEKAPISDNLQLHWKLGYKVAHINFENFKTEKTNGVLISTFLIPYDENKW